MVIPIETVKEIFILHNDVSSMYENHAPINQISQYIKQKEQVIKDRYHLNDIDLWLIRINIFRNQILDN